MSLQQHDPQEFASLQLVRTGNWVRFFAKLTFALLLIAIAAMIFAPWQQTARGVGSVVAVDPQQRPQAVRSPTKGVVDYVKPGLREGTFVAQDELVLRLAPFAVNGISQIDMQITAMESQEAAALSILSVAKQAVVLQESSGTSMTASLNQDLEATKQKWAQSKNEVTSLEAELADKQNQLRIAEEVAGKGLVSREELFTKRKAAQSQEAKVEKSRNAVHELSAVLISKEEEIESKLQEIAIKNRTAEQKVLDSMQKINKIEKEILDLRNKRGEYDRLEIRAPRAGQIQEWFGLEGSDTIKEGDQLFVIVPNADELGVEMQISGTDMPLVQSGDRVRLQFEGWPAVQFVGWPSVAVGTFGGTVNRVFPTDDAKGNFRILVTPDHPFNGKNDWPSNRYLRQGVRANGWVMLKQVRLGYEIWRQLNGFPPVIADQTPEKVKTKLKLPKA